MADDPTFGLQGVNKKFNSKRLEFDSGQTAWFYILKYCKKNRYKLQTRKPLSTKIYDQLRAVISPKAVTGKDLYRAIGFHVNSIKYLNKMRPGTERFNLWGKPDGKVTLDEANYARETLTKLHPAYVRQRRTSRRQGVIVNPKAKGQTSAGETTNKPKKKFTLRPKTKES